MGSARSKRVWVTEYLTEPIGNNLPRNPEFVLQPATTARNSTIFSSERQPKAVDFVLGCAGNRNRRRFSLGKHRTAVKEHDPLGIEEERRTKTSLATIIEHHEARKNARIERDGLFDPTVKPQKGGNGWLSSDQVAVDERSSDKGLIMSVNANNTKVETSGISHDHPMPRFFPNFCSKPLKSSYFGLNVVGVKIKVDPRIPLNFLDQETRIL